MTLAQKAKLVAVALILIYWAGHIWPVILDHLLP